MEQVTIEGIYKWNALKKELLNTAKKPKKKKVEVYSIRLGLNAPRMTFVNLTDYTVVNGLNEYQDGLYTLLINDTKYEFKTGSDLVEVKKVGGK